MIYHMPFTILSWLIVILLALPFFEFFPFSILLNAALRPRFLSVINGNPTAPLRIAQRHCWTIVLWNGYEKRGNAAPLPHPTPHTEIGSACHPDRWNPRNITIMAHWLKLSRSIFGYRGRKLISLIRVVLFCICKHNGKVQWCNFLFFLFLCIHVNSKVETFVVLVRYQRNDSG